MEGGRAVFLGAVIRTLKGSYDAVAARKKLKEYQTELATDLLVHFPVYERFLATERLLMAEYQIELTKLKLRQGSLEEQIRLKERMNQEMKKAAGDAQAEAAGNHLAHAESPVPGPRGAGGRFPAAHRVEQGNAAGAAGRKVMTTPTPEKQLAGFIAKFTPEMATLIRGARKKMRERLPHAIELVYDNYNFFVIGYGPTERPSDAIVSVAAAANGVGLCFIQGAKLKDPKRILKGSGNQTRFLRLESADVLAEPAVEALLTAAALQARAPFPDKGRGKLIIRSISKKQRPRRKANDGRR